MTVGQFVLLRQERARGYVQELLIILSEANAMGVLLRSCYAPPAVRTQHYGLVTAVAAHQ